MPAPTTTPPTNEPHRPENPIVAMARWVNKPPPKKA